MYCGVWIINVDEIIMGQFINSNDPAKFNQKVYIVMCPVSVWLFVLLW